MPDDFNPLLADTRATGHYEVQGSGLRVWTEGNTSTDKVAEYVDTDTPLADVGEPSLDYSVTAGTIPPGYQLVVDFDGNGTPDGILVGEPDSYGDNWWLNNAADPFVKAGAPNTGGGSGSDWFGTLEEWSGAFPNANVMAFGVSLGSGVFGDGVINSITFAGNHVHVRRARRPDEQGRVQERRLGHQHHAGLQEPGPVRELVRQEQVEQRRPSGVTGRPPRSGCRPDSRLSASGRS